MKESTPAHDLEIVRIALESLKHETRFEALGRIALEAYERLRLRLDASSHAPAK